MADSSGVPDGPGSASPRITAPFYVGDWMSLNRAHGLAASDADPNHWIDVVLGVWARTAGIDSADQNTLRTALQRVGSGIPDGVQRFILRRPPYEDPSVMTFWLVPLAEPIRGGAPRRERVAPDHWIMRRRGQSNELHAMLTGTPAPEAALKKLLAEIDVVEGEKGEGALSQLGEFFSFWSFGGRL